MCGITGIYSIKKVNLLEKRIDKMNKSIFHRGPGVGSYYLKDNRLALGHRRLRIIDKRAISNQPMSTNSGRWDVVFNGEIYNFDEIKKDLDYSFKRHSDTEFILAAVEEKGINWFLAKANGMFALALFDDLMNLLYLIRDRLVIKPLYYYNDGETLVFSSEIKGILPSGIIKVEFNELAIDEYLTNRYIKSPYTFLKNIYQVEPSGIIEINPNINFEKKLCWTIPKKFNTSKLYNEKEILDSFKRELTLAIKQRLISDVPLGTYLSDRVDSRLITAITAMNKKEPLNSYTIENYLGSDILDEIYITNNNYVINGSENVLIVNNVIINNANIGVSSVNSNSLVNYCNFWNNGTETSSSIVNDSICIFSNPSLEYDYSPSIDSIIIDKGAINYSNYNGSSVDMGAKEFIDTISSISDLVSDRDIIIEVYPNPANEYLNVILDNEVGFYCEIYNLTGKLVNSNGSSIHKNRLDITSIETGVFILSVILENGKRYNELY